MSSPADASFGAPPYSERPDDGRGGKVVPLRLQKYLARCGVASRRASEDLITAGRVTVNGDAATELGTKVDPLVDEVRVDGRPVIWGGRPVTLMLHKPAGVVTTMRAQSSKPIVADLVPRDLYPGLYPIGRLDADTTGILLFSTDGELGNALLHPSRHVPKTYRAEVRGSLAEGDLQRLREGIMLDDGPALPAEASFAGQGRSCVDITVHEGRYHQVKRMFEALGHPVVRLHRFRFGPLGLEGLEEGAWRELTPAELASLRAQAGLPEGPILP